MGRLGVVVAAALLSSVMSAVPAVAAEADPGVEPVPVAVVKTPVVSGTARTGSTLRVSPGTYEPAEATTAVLWLRNGVSTGRTGLTYPLTKADWGDRISAQVVASAPDRADTTAVSNRTAAVRWASLVVTKNPSVSGTRRFGRTLTALGGTWRGGTPRLAYRWLRDGRAIAGATSRTYRIAPGDVGHRLAFRVRATRALHEPKVVTASATTTVLHRRDVRKTVTYRVVKNGSSSSSLSTFIKQTAQTYADARGWRGAGVRFKRVSKGGSFTLVLAKASRVPSYSSGCSSTYSCRVGRYVIINETRWRTATPGWKKADRSVRDYRHLVVNHETGHWFEKNHAGCGGKGKTAPVMMQQSKGLAGCKANPWPKVSELGLPRYGWKAP
ncbi:MAG: DUF3152 domain-containing protein [Actinomycetales bacterium]|nr:MAG: DUF3152 domain-containing protein [Actinomycetales bacterium]